MTELTKYGFLGGSKVKSLPAMQETQEKWVQSLSWEGPIPGPIEGHGNLPQYSCLKNPTDRGAWQAIVCQRVAKRWTLLK